MLQSFTRNYEDNSTEAGFQFTFYCDLCQDGHKSSFIESETYKKEMCIRDSSCFYLTFFCEACGRGYSPPPLVCNTPNEALHLGEQDARLHFNRCRSCHRWVCDAVSYTHLDVYKRQHSYHRFVQGTEVK